MVTSSANRGTEPRNDRRSLGTQVRQSALTRAVLGVAFVVVPTTVILGVLQGVFLSVYGLDSPYLRLASIVGPLIFAVVVGGSYILYRRVFDAMWPRDLRQVHVGRDLVVGTLLGAGLFTVALAVVWSAGGYSVVRVNALGIVVPAVTSVIFFAGFEEVVNRGIILPEMESRFGSWIALVASSMFFAAYHVVLTANPTGIAVASIFVASLLFGGAYLLTRQLWLPFALHAGWNFTQGAIFGVSVSGNSADAVAFLVGETTGPVWLSGGAYGLEGSLVTLAVLSVATAVVLWRVALRPDLVPRTWPQK